MNLVHGQPPKIIWLKMENQSKAATIKTLLDNKHLIGQALMADGKDCVWIV